NFRLKRLALSIPWNWAHPGTIFPWSTTAPVSPGHCFHFTMTWVTPLRVAFSFFGATPVQRPSSETEGPSARPFAIAAIGSPATRYRAAGHGWGGTACAGGGRAARAIRTRVDATRTVARTERRSADTGGFPFVCRARQARRRGPAPTRLPCPTGFRRS